MKNCFLTLFMGFIILSCTNKSQSKLLFKKDFISENPQWKIFNDTISKEFQIGFKDIKEPVKISWVSAKDSSGCLRIAFVKFENINQNSRIKFENIKSSNIRCGMKFNSSDTRRVETLILFGKYSTNKNIKEYIYDGSLVTIRGNGESIVTKTD